MQIAKVFYFDPNEINSNEDLGHFFFLDYIFVSINKKGKYVECLTREGLVDLIKQNFNKIIHTDDPIMKLYNKQGYVLGICDIENLIDVSDTGPYRHYAMEYKKNKFLDYLDTIKSGTKEKVASDIQKRLGIRR